MATEELNRPKAGARWSRSATAPAPSSRQHIELPELRRLTRAGGRLDEDGNFPNQLRALLAAGPLDESLAREPEREQQLLGAALRIAQAAYPNDPAATDRGARNIDHTARDIHQRTLLAIYQQHMRLPHMGVAINQFHPFACRMMTVLEAPWERVLLARAHSTHDLSDAALPGDGDGFVAWYQRTAFSHPLYEHELYTFLSSEATYAQLKWFLTMECAGEAAFDDLVALAQVGTRGEVKIEMGQNYWDEMGNGKSHAVHTHLFHRLIEGLKLEPPSADELPWQVLSGVNLMLWCCISRRNAFRAQGALGAVELLAPQRCTRVVHAARRLRIAKKTVSYYGAHAIIDIGHAEGWLAHVVRPQVTELPEARLGIAEGLIIRANASLDYFDYCLARLRENNGRTEDVVSGVR